ncbi:hypothetical protein ACQCVK_04175 [Rossellomorea vietnamensis]|uniref:hypothetical protein n=1 Tax=Rossellomorea vietnamensis TaxID=218284 RepID=UPI003CF6F7FC
MDESTKEIIQVLTSQNTLIKDTLFWAIGAMITLIAVFFSANFFVTRSFRKEELSRISSEIELKVRDEFLTKYKEEIVNDIQKLVEEKIKENRAETQKNRTKLTKLEYTVDSNASNLLKEIKLVSASNYSLEGDFHTYKGSYNSALSSYIFAATEYLDNDYLFHIGGLLDDIEQAIAMTDHLDNWEKENIQKVLNKLPDRFKASKETIQKKII